MSIKGGFKMKKSILCYIFAFSIVLGMNMSTITARAQSPELKSAASDTETTEFWQISTERSSKQSEEPKVYSYYNLKLQNNSKRELSNVMLEGYRTSEKNQTKLALFTPVNIGTLPNNRNFTFDNFLLSTNAKEAEFVVSWEEKGRKVKQNFVFNKNNNLMEIQ